MPCAEDTTYPASELGAWFPSGKFIAVADLVGCVQGHDSAWAADGQWHWVFEHARMLSWPVAYPGRLGLFDAPDVDALFRPHDGTTRRVEVRVEVPDLMITRPGPWGNPWKVTEAGVFQSKSKNLVESMVAILKGQALMITEPAQAVAAFENFITCQPELMARLPELKGKRLGCFCEAGQPCHGDVLVRLVEEMEAEK